MKMIAGYSSANSSEMDNRQTPRKTQNKQITALIPSTGWTPANIVYKRNQSVCSNMQQKKRGVVLFA